MQTSCVSDWQGDLVGEITRVTDEELEELVRSQGPHCIEAVVLKNLREGRAKDRQVFAFRIGDTYYTGPVPDAETEATLIDIAEASED